MYAWSCLKCLNRWETSHTVPLGSAVSMWNRSGRQQVAGVTSVILQRAERGGDNGARSEDRDRPRGGEKTSFPAAISASCAVSCAYACMAVMLEPNGVLDVAPCQMDQKGCQNTIDAVHTHTAIDAVPTHSARSSGSSSRRSVALATFPGS